MVDYIFKVANAQFHLPQELLILKQIKRLNRSHKAGPIPFSKPILKFPQILSKYARVLFLVDHGHNPCDSEVKRAGIEVLEMPDIFRHGLMQLLDSPVELGTNPLEIVVQASDQHTAVHQLGLFLFGHHERYFERFHEGLEIEEFVQIVFVVQLALVAHRWGLGCAFLA
jgi:hypothetical protein